MTCTQMLERLIEADPDVLAGRGTSDVAVHVRECVRCRAVADQLLADTRVLAGAVESGPVVRRIRPTPIVLALAVAASLAFAMLPNKPAAPTTVATPARVAAVVPPALPVAESAVAAAVVSRVGVSPVKESPRAESREPRTVPRPQVAQAYPVATPISPTPLALTPSDISFQQVAVTPPPGKRAAVMRTSDPAITVVWVY